ncbi:hypothetical protein HKX48_007585, partial [Thoreauomyces humboldtii]
MWQERPQADVPITTAGTRQAVSSAPASVASSSTSIPPTTSQATASATTTAAAETSAEVTSNKPSGRYGIDATHPIRVAKFFPPRTTFDRHAQYLISIGQDPRVNSSEVADRSELWTMPGSNDPIREGVPTPFEERWDRAIREERLYVPENMDLLYIGMDRICHIANSAFDLNRHRFVYRSLTNEHRY